MCWIHVLLFKRLLEGSSLNEDILVADLDLSLARQKDFVYIAGQFETHRFAARRTDLYGPLVDQTLWPYTREEAGRKTQ